MSIGQWLYLLMCIGTFAGLAGVLAYETWQQGKLGPEMIRSDAEDDRDLAHSREHAAHA